MRRTAYRKDTGVSFPKTAFQYFRVWTQRESDTAISSNNCSRRGEATSQDIEKSRFPPIRHNFRDDWFPSERFSQGFGSGSAPSYQI